MQHTSFTPEEWRPVAGHEGIYEVSSRGNIRSLDRVVTMKNGVRRSTKGRKLCPQATPDGHLFVQVCRDGERKQRYVHHLILETFVGERPEGMMACHGDGNPANNDVRNLRWGTSSDNNLDLVRHGTHRQTRKIYCPYGHKLGGVNNRDDTSRRGYRGCLACHRARGHIRYRPHLEGRHQEVSDRIYRELTAGEQVPEQLRDDL